MESPKKHFGKEKPKSISTVEVVRDGTVIRVSKQFQVKVAVMNENSKRLVLSYSSPLLKVSTLQKIGLKGEKAACQELINSGIMILGVLLEQASFLSLIY